MKGRGTREEEEGNKGGRVDEDRRRGTKEEDLIERRNKGRGREE